MLTVVIPATAKDLTTPARLAELVSLGSADGTTVALLIKHASAAVVNYCRRPFGVETVREDFDYCRISGPLLLSRDPVVAFVEVKDGDLTILSTAYRFDPATGLLHRVDEDGRFLPWVGARLSVTYQAGYVLPSDADGAPSTTLPEPVERAAGLLVAAYLSSRDRAPLLKSETVEGVGSTYWFAPGTAILADPEAEHLLQPYRRLF